MPDLTTEQRATKIAGDLAKLVGMTLAMTAHAAAVGFVLGVGRRVYNRVGWGPKL